MNVSIVIPTYNRLPILEKCLFALENQKLNTNISNYEVIVVDDGSTDGTTSWINKNKANLPHVILFQQEHGGPALGRNLGVIKSKYEIIIFIDSDLIVLDNFINCHVEKLLASQAAAIDFGLGSFVKNKSLQLIQIAKNTVLVKIPAFA